MNRYSITLQHARGRIAIETVSTSWQSALRAVLAVEMAPVAAVLSIADLGVVA